MQSVTNPFNKLDLERLTLEEAITLADLFLFGDVTAEGKKTRKITVQKFLEVFFPGHLRTSQLVEEVGVLATDFIIFNDVSAVDPKERKIKISDFLTALFPANLKLDAVAAGTPVLADKLIFVDVSEGAPKERSVLLSAFITAITPTVAISVTPPGVLLNYCGLTAPAGWLLANGDTIGGATSGALGRANVDTATLYSLLWGSYANTILPIQDSVGVADVRGATAADDFTANKRLPIPDHRGRASVGRDDMGGTAANRITTALSGIDGTVQGAAGGSESRILLEVNLPPHNHDTNVPTSVPTSGATGAVVSTVGASAPVASDAGDGISTPFSIAQPSIITSVIIKL